jgi:hypothetical protein
MLHQLGLIWVVDFNFLLWNLLLVLGKGEWKKGFASFLACHSPHSFQENLRVV